MHTGKVKLAIRPEHVSLGGSIPATVRDVVYQGSFKRIVAIPHAHARSRSVVPRSADTAIATGDKIRLHLPPDKLVVLRG